MSYVCICCDKQIERIETIDEDAPLNPKNAVMLLSYAAWGSKFDFGSTNYNYNAKVTMFFLCDECYESKITKGYKYYEAQNGELTPATIKKE